jgi:16S rRNA (guanine527-N7)-methyltransferase
MELPELDRSSFEQRLREAGAPPLQGGAIDALFVHYEELRRWAPKIDLIGPGAVGELFERHYVESLTALPWLPDGSFRLLDVGTGAGFPGLILAAALPNAEAWLFEPRERRAAFLASVVRKAGLGARVVAARVAPAALAELPGPVHVVTLRALRLDPPLVRALAPILATGSQLLVWSGREEPLTTAGFEAGRTLLLPHSRERHLREYRWLGERA